MKEIGGFFSLELKDNNSFLHDDGVLVNSCRNALQIVLLSLGKNPTVWIPYYTCDTIVTPFKRLGLRYKFYRINERLEIAEFPFADTDYIIYANYFGLKDDYISQLAAHLGSRLIVDNAQSYYSEPLSGISTVYSCRKFFGVPDGGIAFIPNYSFGLTFRPSTSYAQSTHLLKRIDKGGSGAFQDFHRAEEYLNTAEPVAMSMLTQRIMRSIDFEQIKLHRKANFEILHNALGNSNNIAIEKCGRAAPLVYPYFINNGKELRKKLIANKIYVATFWPNIFDWCKPDYFEYHFAEKCVPLPIDQRYGVKEMDQIVEIIKE
ncbi:MAG: hypothetical protein PHS38_08825 [Bacteroidales bacterium]|nr:hypothetical protein [Bacteroidales bacterium]